ncbi:MAG TPA: hypothetical protein VGL07_00075 [Buttiauxella sp.]|jgi:hypothetical protein
MTETTKTELQRTPDEPYGVIEMRFLCAEKIVKRGTGEVIEVTDKMRLLYIYMMNQFLGFSGCKQSFYKDQREMAAALGWSRGKTGEALAGLKRIGLVGTAGRQGNSEVYTVCFLSDISETLDVVHKDWKGKPAWDHARASKNFKSKKSNKQQPEEMKNDGKSESKEPEQPAVDLSTLGYGEQHSIQQPDDHRSDVVSPGDEVSTEEDEPFPMPKAEQVKPFEGPIFINGMVNEAFINSLEGNHAPHRNDDGTLKKFGFAYAMARAYQADREGKPEQEIRSSISVWIEAALPEHIPSHLLPKPEPEYDNKIPF